MFRTDLCCKRDKDYTADESCEQCTSLAQDTVAKYNSPGLVIGIMWHKEAIRIC